MLRRILNNRQKDSLDLWWLYVRYSNSFSNNVFGIQTLHRLGLAKYVSTDTKLTQILSRATVIVQDGSEIDELPILIKRLSKEYFLNNKRSVTNFESETEFDLKFRETLQKCTTVNEVFQHLEVPSSQIQGYSAACALQRLHNLKTLNTDWQSIHSFIRSLVTRELYDHVKKDIKLLPTPCLIRLVRCYLAHSGFDIDCINAINLEIQNRLGDFKLSIPELLFLIEVLSSGIIYHKAEPDPPVAPKFSWSYVSKNAWKFIPMDNDVLGAEYFDKFASKETSKMRKTVKSSGQDLLENAWANLLSRHCELDATTIPTVLHLLPAKHKKCVPFLLKSLRNTFVQLTEHELLVCMDSLLRLRLFDDSSMNDLTSWAYINIHLVTPALLFKYFNIYFRTQYFNSLFIIVLEKCLEKSGTETCTNLLALCMEYLRINSHFSPILMNLAAQHFSENSETYTPLQIMMILRVFGDFNYLPANNADFLPKIEKLLLERQSLIEPRLFLDILVSLAFVDMLPTSLIDVVKEPSFRNKACKEFGAKECLNTITIYTMIKQKTLTASMLPSKTGLSNVSKHSQHCLKSSKMLDELLLKFYTPEEIHPNKVFFCPIVFYNEEGVPLSKGKSERGLTFMIVSRSMAARNTGCLLGSYQFTYNQMNSLGLTPVQIPENIFYLSSNEILQKLSSIINDAVASLVPEKYQKNSITTELSYSKTTHGVPINFDT